MPDIRPGRGGARPALHGVAVARIVSSLLVVALLTACASPPPVPPGIWDLNGDWEGDWDGGAIGRGHVELSLRQVETRVEGELRIAGVPGISATDGPLAGRVRGDTFSFSQHTGVVEGDLRVSEGRMQGYTTGRLRMTLDLYRRAK